MERKNLSAVRDVGPADQPNHGATNPLQQLLRPREVFDVLDLARSNHHFRLARQDRCNELLDVVGAVLVVRVRIDDDVGAGSQPGVQARRERAGEAQVLREADDVIDPGFEETCDGENLGGQTCEGLDATGGTLLCDACAYDLGYCYTYGNGVCEPGETAVTSPADCLSVGIDAVVFMRAEDAEKIITQIINYRNAVSKYAQTAIRNIIGQYNLDELLESREEIALKLKEEIDKLSKEWGIEL